MWLGVGLVLLILGYFVIVVLKAFYQVAVDLKSRRELNQLAEEYADKRDQRQREADERLNTGCNHVFDDDGGALPPDVCRICGMARIKPPGALRLSLGENSRDHSAKQVQLVRCNVQLSARCLATKKWRRNGEKVATPPWGGKMLRRAFGARRSMLPKPRVGRLAIPHSTIAHHSVRSGQLRRICCR